MKCSLGHQINSGQNCFKIVFHINHNVHNQGDK